MKNECILKYNNCAFSKPFESCNYSILIETIYIAKAFIIVNMRNSPFYVNSHHVNDDCCSGRVHSNIIFLLMSPLLLLLASKIDNRGFRRKLALQNEKYLVVTIHNANNKIIYISDVTNSPARANLSIYLLGKTLNILLQKSISSD